MTTHEGHPEISYGDREDIAAELTRLRDLEAVAHVLAPILSTATVTGRLEEVADFFSGRSMLESALSPRSDEVPAEVLT